MRILGLAVVAAVWMADPAYAASTEVAFFEKLEKSLYDFDKKMKETFGSAPNQDINDQKSTPPESSSQSKTAPSPKKVPAAKVIEDRQLVREIQTHLKRLGYNVGVIDGLYGNGTKRAIEAYQRDHKQKVNGQYSKVLLSQLKSTTGSNPDKKIQETKVNNDVIKQEKSTTKDNNYILDLYSQLKFYEISNLGIHVASAPYDKDFTYIGKVAKDSPLFKGWGRFSSGGTIEFAYFFDGKRERECRELKCILEESKNKRNINVRIKQLGSEYTNIKLPRKNSNGPYVWTGSKFYMWPAYIYPIKVSGRLYARTPMTCRESYDFKALPDKTSSDHKLIRFVEKNKTPSAIRKIEEVIKTACGKLNKNTAVGVQIGHGPADYYVVASRNATRGEKCEVGLAHLGREELNRQKKKAGFDPSRSWSVDDHIQFLKFRINVDSQCDFEKPEVVESAEPLDRKQLAFPITRKEHRDYTAANTWYMVTPNRTLAFDAVEKGTIVKFGEAREVLRTHRNTVSSSRAPATGTLDLRTMNFTVIEKFPDGRCSSNTLRETVYKLKPVGSTDDFPKIVNSAYPKGTPNWSNVPAPRDYINWAPENGPGCAANRIKGCAVLECAYKEAIAPVFTINKHVAESHALRTWEVKGYYPVKGSSANAGSRSAQDPHAEWHRQRQIDINELTFDMLRGAY